MKIILRIDPSALKQTACFRQFLLTVLGYGAGRTNVPIEYGSAFHIFKETLRKLANKHKDIDNEVLLANACSAAQKYFNKALASDTCAKTKDHLSVIHLTETCLSYVEKFGLRGEKDNFQTLIFEDEPLIEKTFSIPLYDSETLGIVFNGTIDDIGKFKNGAYAFGDEKTTSVWNKKDYLAHYELSPQLLAYGWAVRWHIRNKKQSTFWKQFEGVRFGAFINGVFLSKTQPTDFQRSEVWFKTDDDYDEFQEMLEQLVLGIVTFHEMHGIENVLATRREGMFNDACLGRFSDCCRYMPVCKAPQAAQKVLLSSIPRAQYNPLLFRANEVVLHKP